LAQAEHGSGYERVWLVTDSGKLLRGVHAKFTADSEFETHEFIEKASIRMAGWCK